MPRQARLDVPGALHHVIVKGIDKRKIANDDQDRQELIGRIGQIGTETGASIYAWALMSNHAHILLRTGPPGLARLMRRVLTGYAIYYNHRHRERGSLFQNRYKSIVCEEKPYFRELVRYIHLNPLRANEVESLAVLDRYRWCGHSIVMGRLKRDWQDRDYVLKWFGETEKNARKAYRVFVKNGVDQGRRPELVGGGLIRSQGGWSEVRAMRRSGARETSDERILGSGKFVKKMIHQSDRLNKKRPSASEGVQRAGVLIDKICRKKGIPVEALQEGNRRHAISRVRSELARKLVEECGLSLVETGRQLGVSAPAIAITLRRRDKTQRD